MSQPDINNATYDMGEIMQWHVFTVNKQFTSTQQPGSRYSLKNYEEPQDIMDWCAGNVKGRWTWRGDNGDNLMAIRRFYFEDKSDAMLFKLTWSDRFKRSIFNHIPG